MKNKSLGVNSLLYTLKTTSAMIFPLITFPYISRVLGVSGIGVYNFSYSFVSYFSLIASLGISAYAIREGAKIRDDEKKFQIFAQEIFSINLFSMTIALVLLIVVLKIFPALQPYENIIGILSCSIPLTVIGTEWIFNVYEDFVYITLRSIIFQFVSMILMFSLVKTREDVWKYAMISVIAAAGSNILNLKKVKKHFKHKISPYYECKKHVFPVLVLFASTIASQIYVNSDITMLGILKSDYDTGIYSAASKIYNIVRVLLTTVITILLPRLSYLNAKGTKDEYVKFLSKTFNAYVCIVLPSAIGLMCIAKEAILLISGEEFVVATNALKILCLAMIFSSLGSFIANAILIVHSKEKIVFKATCIGASVNFIANFFFISQYSYNGAAITTLLSEMIVLGIQTQGALRCTKIENIRKNMYKVFVGIFGILVMSMWCAKLELALVSRMVITIGICGVVYVGILLLLKQEMFVECYTKFRSLVCVLLKNIKKNL